MCIHTRTDTYMLFIYTNHDVAVYLIAQLVQEESRQLRHVAGCAQQLLQFYIPQSQTSKNKSPKVSCCHIPPPLLPSWLGGRGSIQQISVMN